MPYRFTDHSRTRIVCEETRATLDWDPVRNQLVSDHGFAGEDYRRAGSPQPLAPVESVKTPDDHARRLRRAEGDDRRRG